VSALARRVAIGVFAALPVFTVPAQGQTKAVTQGSTRKAAIPAAPVTGARKVDAMLDAVFGEMNVLTDMHFHKGEYNHIVNLSRMTVGALPSDVDMYADAAWLLWSMDRDDEAIALYEQGIKANPNSFYMLDELGHYYFNRKKDWPKAVAYYERAAAKPDRNEITLHMLAHAYERNKQLDKALDTWKLVLKHNDAGPARVNYDRIKRLIDSQGSGK
jgi:tetratricopeptide (TPR) repeat protein